MRLPKKAMARKTGARGLRSIVENALLETMYELPSMKNAKTVIVDEQVINEGKTPEIDLFYRRLRANSDRCLAVVISFIKTVIEVKASSISYARRFFMAAHL